MNFGLDPVAKGRAASMSPTAVPAAGDIDAFARDVLDGLARTPKRIPSKYFYDARGSALFEQICAQPEYYLTRVELAIMQTHAAAIADALGPGVRLVEFGCGNAVKTRQLLAALERPAGYVPVEISAAALHAATRALREQLPSLPVQPVCADFTAPFALPPAPGRCIVYFPGSTLGNFDPPAARALLQRMRGLAGDDGAVLLGLDMKKPVALLEAAYNDAAGVTAAFTLNLLVRINRELDGDFLPSRFVHVAHYVPERSRIETRLVSRVAQTVQVAGRRFGFAAREPIEVEISSKYSFDDVQRMAADAGLCVDAAWHDPARWFGVFLLRPD